MIMLTETAQKELDSYFEDKETGTIRVYVGSGGCSGPRLMLALDEATGEDEILTVGQYTFCMEKELLKEAEEITIDCSAVGFSVTSNLVFSGGGCPSGGCSGCGSH